MRHRRSGGGRATAQAMALLIAGSACAEGPGALGTFASHTVRDSAGVTIIENRRPAWEEGGGWSVEPEPLVIIGRVEAPTDPYLHGVRSALRLADGKILVSQSGPRISLYGADGSFLRNVAGPGEGPGELRSTVGLSRAGRDTLFRYDRIGGRAARFDPEGAVLDEWRVPPVLPFAVVGAGSDGGLFGVRIPSNSPGFRGPGVDRPLFTVMSQRPTESERVDPLFAFPGSEWYIAPAPSTGGGPVAFSLPVSVPYGRSGGFAHSDRMSVTWTNDRFAFEIRSPALPFPVQRIVRVPGLDVPLTRHDVDSLVVRAISIAPEASRASRAAIYHGFDYPSIEPRFNGVTLATDGSIWLRSYRFLTVDADLPRAWYVFDGEGRWLGEVEVPTADRVMEIGDDYVLLLVRDELDVEILQLHRIVKPDSRLPAGRNESRE